MEDNKNNQWWQEGVALFINVVGWIAFPVIAALYIGDYLDARYGKENVYLLICIAIAFGITMIGLLKNTKSYIKKIEKESKNHVDDKSKRNS